MDSPHINQERAMAIVARCAVATRKLTAARETTKAARLAERLAHDEMRDATREWRRFLAGDDDAQLWLPLNGHQTGESGATAH